MRVPQRTARGAQHGVVLLRSILCTAQRLEQVPMHSCSDGSRGGPGTRELWVDDQQLRGPQQLHFGLGTTLTDWLLGGGGIRRLMLVQSQ